MLVTQKDQGREKYTQAPIASRKSIIDEIVQAGQDKLKETVKARGLAIPQRYRGKAWRKLYSNVVCLKDTVFNIVVKGKAIKILLPGLKDKSLFVEASEDVFEFIREQSSRVVPEPKSEKTQSTEIDEDGLASAVKERNAQHDKGTMGVLLVHGCRKLRARKPLPNGSYRARYFDAEFQSIDLAAKFLNSAEDDNDYISEQADADMESADGR